MSRTTQGLPKGVYKHGRHYTLMYRVKGKQRRVRLCPLGSPVSAIWAAYEDFMSGRKFTIGRIIKEYTESHVFKSLAISTQKDYQGAIDKLLPVFGDMAPHLLRVTQVQKYMDLRTSKKRANVERTVLMNVYKWAMTRYDEVMQNPAAKAQPFKLTPRKRYMTDAEYVAIHNVATLPVKVAMDLSYLLAARQGDILKLKWSDVREDGIYIEQNKTGKAQIKEINPDVQAVLDQAKNTGGIASAVYVVSNRSGQNYTASGFKTMWKKAKLKAGIKDVTFHDIKGKAISDYEGDKQAFSGHKTRSMMELYNRTPDKVKSGKFGI